MNAATTELSLQTLLALAGGAAGLWLHLRWHPCRELQADAWRQLRRHPWALLVLAAVHGWAGSDVAGLQGLSWTGGWWERLPELLLAAAQDHARLLHGLLPAWPTALVLPVLLSLWCWGVGRAAGWGLWLATLLFGFWSGLEIAAGLQTLPAEFETARRLLRWPAEALALALTQLLVVRAVLATTRSRRGWIAELGAWLQARRQGWLLLALLDALWLLAWRSAAGGFAGAGGWWLAEAPWLFAALPVAVAAAGGTWLAAGRSAMLATVRALPAFLGTTLTALVLLMLVHGGLAILREAVAGQPWPARLLGGFAALALATLRSWLLLTAVLTFHRHGLKTADRRGRAC